jgi:hypothetical protein
VPRHIPQLVIRPSCLPGTANYHLNNLAHIAKPARCHCQVASTLPGQVCLSEDSLVLQEDFCC